MVLLSALVSAGVGLYIIIGLVVAAGTSDCPPFWPPMKLALAPLEALGTPESVIVLALLYMATVVLLGPCFLIWGVVKLHRCWKAGIRLSPMDGR
ncbi:MAG: hypothetical protein C4K60_06270 [Ideonella sp. MAG2]|nr:MAG: hypothetical protein C4K60_06270 [Ideonella sp. MAG2]